MIAKKPQTKPKPTVSEARLNKFIRSAGAAAPSKNGRPGIPVLIYFPSELLDWITAEAAKDARSRIFYVIRALQDHRTRVERGD